jgi:hypothetical protein
MISVFSSHLDRGYADFLELLFSEIHPPNILRHQGRGSAPSCTLSSSAKGLSLQRIAMTLTRVKRCSTFRIRIFSAGMPLGGQADFVAPLSFFTPLSVL